MLFRQICAFLFLIIFSGIFEVSAQSSDVEKNSNLESLPFFTESSDESELIEIPDSHILLNSRIYNAEQGLSQNTVTSFVKDAAGFLWVGTFNGLNRFDGTEFKKYFTEDGLPNTFIRSLFVLDDGNLLIGTNSGLALLDKKNQSVNPINIIEFKNKPIWDIKSHNNSIYVSTDSSIIKLNNTLSRVQTIFESKRVIDIKDFIIFNEEILYLTHSKNLYSIKHKTSRLIRSSVSSIEKSNGKAIFSTKSGTYKIDNTTIKKISNIHFNHLYKSDYLYGISKNEVFNLSQRIHLGRLKGTKNHIVDFYAKNGNFYIGTLESGIKIISKEKNIVSLLNLTHESIWDVKKHKEKLLFASTSGLHFFDQKLNKKDFLELKNFGLLSIFTNENELYLGTESGLFKADENKNLIKILDTPTFSINGNDNVLYIGDSYGNIYELVNEKVVDMFSITKNQPIYHIEIGNNELFLSTASGLFSYKNRTKTLIDNEDTYKSCMHKNKLYYGTNTSINTFNPKNNTKHTLLKTNKTVFSTRCFDDLVISTALGNIIIFKDNKKYILRPDNGTQKEYNTSTIIKSGNRYIFGGVEGLSILEDSKVNQLTKSYNSVNIFLSSLLVFNKEVKDNTYYSNNLNNSKKITLKFSEYPFSIKFSSFDANSVFKYRLLGLNNNWIYANNNSATFTNLPHGNYVFELIAESSISKKQSKIKKINIEITPPWWLSFEAKCFYVLLTLVIILLVIKGFNKKRQTQLQIAMSEERLKLSLWGSGDEMWDWDIETGKIYRSNMWESLDFPVVGQRADNENQRSNIHPMDRKRVHQHLEDHLQDKTEHFEISYRVKSKDNQWIWILDRAKVVVRDDDGTPMRMTGTIKNINDLKNTEEQLKLFGKAIENISEGMFILDHSFTFIEVNQACLDITQTTKEDYLGKILKFDQYPDSYSHQIQHMLRNHGRWTNEVDAKRGDGTSFTMDLTIDAIYDDNGNTNHYVAVFSDVSLRKQHEVELQKMSTSDVLTGLPNRSYLQVTLSNLVKRQVPHALMILDIDNFKKINDSLGHNVGDELLQMVTQRIITAVKGEANIYRLGGDEFAILIESTPDIGSAAAMANRVIDTFKSPIEIENTKLVVGASIGIVFYPDDEENEQALLRKAEVAMYSAKSAGGNRYHFYSESQNSNAIRQLEVENLIREGLANDYFEVYYQPKVNVKSNKLAGMEALVRLIHPEHGMISPAEFIPLAEETGLIVELGDVVLEKACRATQKWRIENNFNGRVAVNLSSRQFALPNLQERIQHILDETGLPAENLEIEITESTVIKHPERAIKVMEKLTQMGIHLALDDFGTGYSSLTYLKRFPIHCLKIDKAFIDDIDKSDRDLKMVDSIITIAHNMGLSVVAEGVEEQSQLGILRALKCEEIQGYLFSKPLPTSEFQNQLN